MKSMKLLILFSSIAVCAVLLVEAVRTNVKNEWREHQQAYKEQMLKAAKTPEEKTLADNYKIMMRQVVLPELDMADRCVSCHVGIEDPRMKDMPQPIRAHPGDILEKHDLEKVGCTVCHDGQGRAMTAHQAHARGHEFFWEKPLLAKPFLQANCVRCHKDTLEANANFNKGKEIFLDKDCYRCHKTNGKGGIVGPDLSDIGNVSFHVKLPVKQNYEKLLKRFNENVNIAYLFEAVDDARVQPKDSKMVQYKFADEDAVDLTVYLKSMSGLPIPASVQSRKMPKMPADPAGRGAIYYGMYCKGCHGTQGQGKVLSDVRSIIPAVGNKEFLSIADTKFLTHAISYARGGQMAPYITRGGLNTTEIQDIVSYLQTFRGTPPALQEVVAIKGNKNFGRDIFQGNCANCHGFDGKFTLDSIGPTLNNSALAGLGDKEFFYRTITEGRAGTAMPAWRFLTAHDLADLLAYLDTFNEQTINKDKTLALVKSGAKVHDGDLLFKSRCGVCHGYNAEGGIGPSLMSPEFQRVADAGYIYKVMAEGRKDTSMPTWDDLSSEDAADIIAYVKSFQRDASKNVSAVEVKGDTAEGKELFQTICSQCHGSQASVRSKSAPAILSKSFLSQASDGFIKEMAMYGRTYTGMKPNLKAMGGLTDLSEGQIDSIVAYIRSFEKNPVSLVGKSSIQGDPFVGREMFKTSCAQCHGNYAQGATGPGIGRSTFLSTVSDGFILGMARMGRTDSEMKPFGLFGGGDGFATLSDKDLSDVVAFLRSNVEVADNHAKLVQGVPEAGEILFNGNCSQCHGKKGKGGIAPELNNDIFLKKTASDSYLQATLALGRPNTQMRSMMKGGDGVVELYPKEINNTISYIRSLQK